LISGVPTGTGFTAIAPSDDFVLALRGQAVPEPAGVVSAGLAIVALAGAVARGRSRR